MHENTYKRKFKFVYWYILDGVAIAIGEIGISGYMAYMLKHRRNLQ
jgi:hypothetical protein